MSNTFTAAKYVEMDMGLQETGFQKARNIEIPDALYNRWETGSEPFDTAFGGVPMVPGMTFTFCGIRGTGKTTWLSQMMQRIMEHHDGEKLCGFTSGEEPVGQLRMNFKRTNVEDVMIANMTYVEDLCEVMDDFDFLVIDSFQSLRSRIADIGPRQIEKYAQNRLIARAKETNCIVGFIMHCNKKGEIKGGTNLPHSVDLEMSIERRSTDVRAIVVDKFRFGPIGEVGLKMTEAGMDLDEAIDLDMDEETDGNGGTRAKLKEEHMDMLMSHLQEKKRVGYKDLYQSVDLPATRISSLLRELQDKGCVEKEGTRKHNMVFHWTGE